jgi:hypothetical protein
VTVPVAKWAARAFGRRRRAAADGRSGITCRPRAALPLSPGPGSAAARMMMPKIDRPSPLITIPARRTADVAAAAGKNKQHPGSCGCPLTPRLSRRCRSWPGTRGCNPRLYQRR